jgi:hypothetical protein
MAIEQLGPAAQDMIRRALAFISTTRHLDEEFETRMGVERGELAAMLMRWPRIDDRADDSPAARAINNALNEVVSGLPMSAEDWRHLGASRLDVEAVYAEWAGKRGWSSMGLR